jgi:hypothetical protein
MHNNVTIYMHNFVVLYTAYKSLYLFIFLKKKGKKILFS